MVDRGEVAKALRQALGLDGDALAFVPTGWDDQFLMGMSLVFRQQLDESPVQRCLSGLRP